MAPTNDRDDVRRRQPFRSLSLTPSNKSTPPRQVILTPRATPKPIRRRVSSRPTTKVKSEPPELDLSKVRPPSPSDDPLLLSGTRTARSPPLRARFTPPFSSSPPASVVDFPPPTSFAARLAAPSTDVHALPTFNALRTVEEASDSDDDGFNLTGEYTGKYKILRVPTKTCPPIREPNQSWGRPVSPFPYSEIMERSLPLSDVQEEGGWREVSSPPCEDASMWEVATEPPPSDVELSPPPSASEDEFAKFDKDFPLFDIDAESTRIHSFPEPREPFLDSDPITLEEEEEEDQIDRELSVAPDVPLILNQPADDSSDEEDDVEGQDIIKITSEDPKAAARAAAILRMHDYDCILAAEKKRRSNRLTRKRRKTIENAGISKSYTDLRSRRWPALHGANTSPGSRSLPLLELWRDAEDSVFLEHYSKSQCDASTLSPTRSMSSDSEPLLPPLTGKWTRECWKCLDKCLVAEQLAVAAAHGLGTHVFADVHEISKDAVLDRFATRFGGDSVLAGLGRDWSRDNLMLRLDVLIKKQSQRAMRTRDVTEPRYRGLLEEAMALSETRRRESASVSDTTVISDRSDMHEIKMMLPDVLPPSYSESSWQAREWRGPIRTPTPSCMLDRRWPHPKDQVHLRHMSPPPRSMIPVPVRPKRLVDLRHCSPTKANGQSMAQRRSSGCSVRELVKQFETLDQ